MSKIRRIGKEYYCHCGYAMYKGKNYYYTCSKCHITFPICTCGCELKTNSAGSLCCSNCYWVENDDPVYRDDGNEEIEDYDYRAGLDLDEPGEDWEELV